MMEKVKTAVLIALVALSLLQSYLLAYSMPGLGVTVRSEQDYVTAEPLGTPSSVESVIFPEELVLHMGDNRHTVLYPGTQFYDMILKQRIVGREFKGLQRSPAASLDWEEIRSNDIGIELRFGSGLPVDLLQKLLKLEGDLLFLNERIERIWIFKITDSEEVRTFFFSSDGENVYEAVRADLTVRDVQDYVGFGEHLPLYRMTADGLYIPVEPIQANEVIYPYETYSPEQMQRSLFFDSSTTKAIVDRSGAEIFTDGKRGLKVEQNGLWISFTNSAAGQSSDFQPSENVYVSVDFVNQQGGWDGVHRLMSSTPEEEKKHVLFRKYVDQYPVIDVAPFRYGYIRLTLQQGVVAEYSRPLITLKPQWESRTPRWLQGGELLESRLDGYERRDEIAALYPALKAVPLEEHRLLFAPVWAVRLSDGTEHILMDAYPVGYEPPISEEGEEAAGDGEAEDVEAAEGASSGDAQNGGASRGGGAGNAPGAGAGAADGSDAETDGAAGGSEGGAEAPPPDGAGNAGGEGGDAGSGTAPDDGEERRPDEEGGEPGEGGDELLQELLEGVGAADSLSGASGR